MPLLEVEALSKSYGESTAPATFAIENISFHVEHGEFVALVGPSGCGKTTLLMCIAGLIAPSAGRVAVKSNLVDRPPPDLVLVFQEYNRSLFAWRTVLGNVLFGLEAKGRRGAAAKDRALHLLGLVGLEGFEAHYPWQLSGGMQQRVAIARALAYEPEVLLMDEPFGSVDAMTRLELEDALLALWGELGTTILLVTHDIEEAIYLSDRVHVLARRPSRIVETVNVPLARPRNQVSTRAEPGFMELRNAIYRRIADAS